MATLNEPSGVLTSPYYPRRYPSNEKCNWKITARKENALFSLLKTYILRLVVHLASVTTWKYKTAHPLMAFQAGEDVDYIKTVG